VTIHGDTLVRKFKSRRKPAGPKGRLGKMLPDVARQERDAEERGRAGRGRRAQVA
jgi:hypothetical protein